MRYVSYWVMVCSWCIIVHTLCKRNLLLYSRVHVLPLCRWDICIYDWYGVMLQVFYKIYIKGWCIVMHALS